MKWMVSALCLVAIGASAQMADVARDRPEKPFRAEWLNLQGSFLEPNRFATVYDQMPQRLRLEAGYGGELLKFRRSAIGAEILIWSGLKTLSDFRFPVETADYFFGIYSVSVLRQRNEEALKLRTRLSHISSHLVDGAQDSVVGGSSSKFSREFVSAELLWDRYERHHYALSGGVKYVFHQVNKFEPTLQFPFMLDYRFLRFNRRLFMSAYLSTAAGPSLPVYSAGLVFYSTHMFGESGSEIYAEYHDGHSRYGVDGDRKENGFEVGIRLCKID